MSKPTETEGTRRQMLRSSDTLMRAVILGVAAALMAATAVLLNDALLQTAMIVASALLGIAAACVTIFALRRRYAQMGVIDVLRIAQQDAPQRVYATDLGGNIAFANTAAVTAGDGDKTSILEVLSTISLDAEAKVLEALQAAQNGDVYDAELGQREPTIVLKVQPTPAGIVVWDLRKPLATSAAAGSAVTGGNAVRLPMLTVGRSGTVLFMNPAARSLLGERKKTIEDVFGVGVTKLSAVSAVQTASGEQRCLVAEFDATAGRREVYLLPTESQMMKEGAVNFDGLPVALLKLEPEGKVVLANRAARDLIQLPIDSTTVLSDLMEGLGRSIVDWLMEASQGKTVNHSEFLRLKREDKEVIVQVSLNRVVEDGESSLMAVLSDATELKSLEAQFVQSQKMQAIGQLAGGVAHDFNNLLTAISGHCDLLLLRHDQGDSDYADLIQINQNANRAAALVGQLLAFSRKQNLRPEVLDLRNTLADLTHLLNRLVGEKVRLMLSNDPVLPSIRADKRQLEQVLMNLVVNARDAMPEGGEIHVTTESIELNEALERDRVVVPVGRYVSVSVRDEGIGIAPDKVRKVFEPFYTTKKTGEGTGLGLSTAYGIVKQTGGYIFVDSVEGEGTTFTLMFPAHGAAEEFVADSEIDARPDLPAVEHTGVVLLVEDEAPVRSFAARALKMRGFTVLEAASGEEALELLGTDKPNIDVFVSDVIMPGLDGPSWVRQARHAYPDVPVIFVSGYAEDSFSDDQARIANSSFLPKPFSLGDLTEAVQARVGA